MGREAGRRRLVGAAEALEARLELEALPVAGRTTVVVDDGLFAVYPQFELEGAEELLVSGSSEIAARLLIQRAA